MGARVWLPRAKGGVTGESRFAMDYEEHDRSFSFLVETRTLDDILSPIADKVSYLLRAGTI